VVAIHIPVERIAGPVLLDCAGQDEVCSACRMQMPSCLHLTMPAISSPMCCIAIPMQVMASAKPLPYEPFATPSADPHYSGDQIARSDIWPGIWPSWVRPAHDAFSRTHKNRRMVLAQGVEP
jgi:hypothetical protein